VKTTKEDPKKQIPKMELCRTVPSDWKDNHKTLEAAPCVRLVVNINHHSIELSNQSQETLKQAKVHFVDHNNLNTLFSGLTPLAWEYLKQRAQKDLLK